MNLRGILYTTRLALRYFARFQSQNSAIAQSFL